MAKAIITPNAIAATVSIVAITTPNAIKYLVHHRKANAGGAAAKTISSVRRRYRIFNYLIQNTSRLI
jgi:hypothetical protein